MRIQLTTLLLIYLWVANLPKGYANNKQFEGDWEMVYRHSAIVEGKPWVYIMKLDKSGRYRQYESFMWGYKQPNNITAPSRKVADCLERKIGYPLSHVNKREYKFEKAGPNGSYGAIELEYVCK